MNVEAMAMLAELKIRRTGGGGDKELEEAFMLLNHCLKFDYRRPELWTLLGDLYSLKG